MSESAAASCIASIIDSLRANRRPFDYGFDQRVGYGVHGLYAFWLGRRCLYIGMSTDISRRLHQHRTQEHNARLLKYLRAWWRDIEASYVALDLSRSTDLQALERAAITTLRPMTNVVHQRAR